MQSPARLAFLIYFGVTLSKGLWFPYLPDPYFWVADVLCFVVLPAALVFGLKLPLLPEYAIGIKKPRREPPSTLIFFSLILAISLWAAYSLSGYFAQSLIQNLSGLFPVQISYTAHIPKSGFWAFFVVVYFALTAGLVEEYFFRGLLNTAMAQTVTKNVFVYVIVSTISFTAIHWAGGAKNLVSTFLPGLVLAVAFVRTRDLRVCMLGHGLFWLKWLF